MKGVDADSPGRPVISYQLHRKRASVTGSIQVQNIQTDRKRVSVTQTDSPLIDPRTIVVHFQ